VLATALAVAAWALADDARPIEANHTKIIVSKSPTNPTEETLLVAPRNGDPIDLYVWAVNVHNSTGASAFDVRFSHDPALGDITFLEWYGSGFYSCSPANTNTCWIGSSGRSPSCLGAIGPTAILDDGEAYASCSSFQPPPPYGAVGTGKLAHIQFTPSQSVMSGAIDMSASFLVDTPFDIEDYQTIPATTPYLYVTLTKCADFDLNGDIDLFNDILGVAMRFGQNVGDPGWESKYVLDDSGNIDLFFDIINTALQFGGHC
jgi:hypothetical protein